jgi:hypothetical protein
MLHCSTPSPNRLSPFNSSLQCSHSLTNPRLLVSSSAPSFPARKLHPRPPVSQLRLCINELRASASAIIICIPYRQRSNLAVSSHLATLQRHLFRKLQARSGPRRRHSLSSVLAAKSVAPSPTTAGCAAAPSSQTPLLDSIVSSGHDCASDKCPSESTGIAIVQSRR